MSILHIIRGDYNKDFKDLIKRRLNISLPTLSQNEAVLNKDLNCGKIDIIGFVEGSIKRKVTNKEEKIIRYIWNNVWHPHNEIKKILIRLNELGYDLHPCSNLDKENGVIYKNRGYFNVFKKPYFLSYDIKHLKTDPEFFEYIKETLKCKADKILFIDNSEHNIKSYCKKGFKTIHFNNKTEKIEELIKKLNASAFFEKGFSLD